MRTLAFHCVSLLIDRDLCHFLTRARTGNDSNDNRTIAVHQLLDSLRHKKESNVGAVLCSWTVYVAGGGGPGMLLVGGSC